MTANETKLIKSALKPFLDSGMISEQTMQELVAVKEADGKGEKLVTRKEAVEMLGVCIQSLINYEKENLLPPIKIAGKRLVRYRLSDLQALVK